MSTAAALRIWRTYTFSVIGVSTSIIRAISRIRLMFASVSVMMIELVRSKTSSTPLADLKPSSAFCASSIEMLWNGTTSETTRVDSLSSAFGSMISGMPSLRTSLRGIARQNFSP